MNGDTGGPIIECAVCGDRIRSMSRHDFVECKCRATFIDGGSSYLRIGGRPVKVASRVRFWPVQVET